MRFLDMFFGKKDQTHSAYPFGKRLGIITPHDDLSEGMSADVKLLNQIWHGENNGYNLATGLVHTPIAVPCQLIGLPHPVADNDDKETQAVADEIAAQMCDDLPAIEQTKQVHGTSWRWCRYDAKRGLTWEFIQDDAIEQIEIDIINREITGIWTREQFEIASGERSTQTIERVRHITKARIDVTWVNKGSGLNLDDYSQRNNFGFLPLPNGHECDSGKWRGYSVIGRTMRLVKSYHDVFRNCIQVLSEFEPKWVQTTPDVKQWLTNNGFDTTNGIVEASRAAYGSHFQINLTTEKSEYVFMPSGVMEQYKTVLDFVRREIISGGSVPEIFYGNLATGNEASVASHINVMVAYINALRRENIAFYDDLFNQSLKIRGFIDGREYGTVHTSYEAVDLMSAKERADVFNTLAAGLVSINNSALMTEDDVFFIVKGFYPTLPEKEVETFKSNLWGMIQHKANSNTDAATLSDIGNTNE